MSIKPSIAMNLRLFVPAALILFTLGCGRTASVSDQVTANVERTVKEVVVTEGVPVTVADLSIEGMSCEQMCGGAIRKALAGLGVEGTEIKMNEAEGPDHAIVTYDPGKVSDAQMIEAIQKLHDGQYKVIAVAITKQVKGTTATSGEEKAASDEKGVSAYSGREVVLPSIVALLSRILRL
jgi:copper chaperone CopZ